MGAVVQTRLDKRSQAVLDRLIDQGWTTSEILREGIVLFEESKAASPRRRLIGVGCVESGVPDLATNKQYMEDFGAKSMGRGWRPAKKDLGQ